MCPHRDYFSTYSSVDSGVVLIGDNTPCKIVGLGTIRFKMHNAVIRTLTNVRHVPGLKRNLISLGALDNLDCRTLVGSGILQVVKGSKVVIKGRRQRSLYVMDGTLVCDSVAAVDSSGSSADTSEIDVGKLWHIRLAHMSEKGLSILSKRGLLDGQAVDKIDFCEECVLGKFKRSKFGPAVHRTKGTLDYIHSDLCGPSRKPSLSGS